MPRQSCTVVPAAVMETSASPSVEPLACAAPSGAVSVTPVPEAPAVPTVCTTAGSPSTVTWWPATMPVTLATLTLVAPIAAAADSVVLRGRSRRCVESITESTTLVPVGFGFGWNVTTSPG